MSFNISEEKAIYLIKEAIKRVYKSDDYKLILRNTSERSIAFRFGYNLVNIVNDTTGIPDYLSIDSEYGNKGNQVKELYAKCVGCQEIECFVKQKLADQIGRYIFDDKRKYPKMFPDILLHKRDSCDEDIFAIEIKLQSNSSEDQRINDRGKLTYLTCQKENAPYKYQYGFFLDMGSENCLYKSYINREESSEQVLYERTNHE